MSPKEKQRYKIWLRQANFDLKAGEVSIKNGFNEWAAYQAEQAVEKALKGVIVHGGETPPKIHKLSVLFGYCNNLNQAFRNTKFQFRYVESFAFISRYPFLIPSQEKAPHEMITKDEAERALEEAVLTIEKITSILKGESVRFEDKLPEPVSRDALEKRLIDITDVLVREFKPESIVLFGSYARKPLPTDLSTIDILIIAETDLPFTQRIIKARDLTKGGQPSIEPLIYTPEEYVTMTEVEGESFFESALEEGRVLYSKEKK